MIELAQPTRPWAFDGVVRLTRIGSSFLVFTFVIGFAALNTGNNALYIGLTFMLGCLLLSGIASKGGLKHLRVELRELDEAWAGKQVHCALRIGNESPVWNIRDVVLTSGEMAAPILVPMVPKRGAVDVNASFLFQRRGVVRLKGVDLYTRYPFGFFVKKRRSKLTGEVVVFPRLLTDEESRTRFRAVIGEQVSANRPGPGSEIHSFREYVRGDSLRHVYWRKSAGQGRWIMKQTELESATVVHMVVDPYKPPGVNDEQFEEMISAAATFLYHSTHRGLSVFMTMGGATLQANDSNAANALFHALAVVEATTEFGATYVDEDAVVFALARKQEV